MFAVSPKHRVYVPLYYAKTNLRDEDLELSCVVRFGGLVECIGNHLGVAVSMFSPIIGTYF